MTAMLARDTIFALASGAVPSGVAIIRVSGPAAHEAGRLLVGSLGPIGSAVYRTLRKPDTREVLDAGLILAFAAPHSFTGEDVVEFQIHGSRATVAAVQEELALIEGCRSAEPGEFSRRAFENGRLDLTEIEGLSDLIAAETAQQRKLAISQSGGALRELYTNWRNQLIELRALMEADLDFSDEEDVPGSVAESVNERVSSLSRDLENHLASARVGEVIRDGFDVVLAGPPNVGKSTLLNNLAQRDAAIVTDVPGTTRDTITVALDIDDYRVTVRDTAGLRETEDVVEQEGIRRTHLSIAEADFVIGIVDGRGTNSLTISYDELICSFGDHDEQGGLDMRTVEARRFVIGLIRTALKIYSLGEQPLATRARHTERVFVANGYLHQALEASGTLELQAECLREATSALEELTGHIAADELLGSIFSQFCIGK